MNRIFGRGFEPMQCDVGQCEIDKYCAIVKAQIKCYLKSGRPTLYYKCSCLYDVIDEIVFTVAQRIFWLALLPCLNTNHTQTHMR